MEQRPLRLGDIVDDYCTRERRVTNHAIVAVVENVIRQTRCTTCDTEHAYKGAREPRLRKKPPTSALYDQVLANVTGDRTSAEGGDPVEMSVEEAAMAADDEQSGAETANQTSPLSEQDDAEAMAEPPVEGGAWLAHRRLIRATLPRTDNEPPAPRPIPEFTMHQRPQAARGGRGFRFRGGPGNGNGNGNGNGQSPNGFGGHGNRHGNNGGRPGRHRGKKHR